MPFLPDCFSALTVAFGAGQVALQRWLLTALLGALLCCHLAPAAALAAPGAPPSALLLLLCAALAALALAALPYSPLGYCQLHAALSCALLALALGARCGLLPWLPQRPRQQPSAPPLPRAPHPDTKPWLALGYLLLAAALAHSSALRLQACAGDATLAWLDLALAGTVAVLAAAAFGNALFAATAAAAADAAAAPGEAAAAAGGGGGGGGGAAEDLAAPLLAGDESLQQPEAGAAAPGAAAAAKGAGALPPPPPSLHDHASAASVCTFSWMDALFSAGLQRQLCLGDLEGLPSADATDASSALLQAALEPPPRAQPAAASLARVLLQCYGRAWALVGLLQAGCVLTALAAPLALKGLLEYLQGSAVPSEAPAPLAGLGWVAALGLVQLASALCTTQLNYRVTRLQLRVRAGLVGALQRRVLSAPLAVRRGLSSGYITNLVSVDVDRVLNLIPSFHQFWTLPLQVAAVVAELQAQVSYAALGGVGVLCVMVPLNIYVARWLGSLTAVMMKARDARVQATGEVLGGMRAVKLSGWEVPLLHRIAGHRAKEFAALATRKYLDAVCVWCWAATPLLMALTTFSLTLLLPSEGAFFTPAKVWASLAMLNLLIFPLNAFPWVLSGLLEARVSLQRLDDFLLGAGGEKNSSSSSSSSSTLATVEAVEGALDPLVTVRGDFAHAPGAQKDEEKEKAEEEGPAAGAAGPGDAAPFALRLGAQGLSVAAAEVVCVCGAMASGKTSLLLALQGELTAAGAGASGAPPAPAARTELSAACTVTYAPQQPWVRDGSLQENIVFGEALQPLRLARVLEVTGLTEEAAARGLHTPVTETMLSGGQRARIGLARALYMPSALVLLDGVTAALDARVAVAVWLATVAFCRAERRACVAVVSDARYLASADRVVVLGQGGGLLYCGAPAGLPEAAAVASGMHAQPGAAAASAGREGGPAAAAPSAALPAPATAAAPAPAAAADGKREGAEEGPAAGQEVEEEFREKGYVKGSVLAEYARAVGVALSCTVLVSALVMQGTRNGADAWLSVWSASTVANGASDPLSELSRYLVARQWRTADYLVLFAALANANFVLTALRAWSFARAGLRAAAVLHTRLLVGIVGAAQAFHDATPSGRLLNRLSGDVFSTDDSLPFSVNILLAQFVGLLGTVVILGVSTYGLFLLLLPLLCVSFLRLQARYRATSRELKRVDATTRSPLLTQFADLRRGEAVLLAASLNRAPTAAASPLHRERALGLALLDRSQRTTFASGMAGQWLGLRLQLLGMLVLGILCVFCFLLRVFSLPQAAALFDDGCPAPAAGGGACAPPATGASASASLGSASVAGLILSLSLPVVYQLQGLLGAFTDTEKEFISVERTLEYAALPAEDAASAPAMTQALQDGSANASVSSATAAAAPGAPLLPLPPQPWQPPHHGLTLEGVRVTYPGAAAPALQLTLQLPAGTRLGVVGRTGSGKSTLLALLWRLVPCAQGRVLLGGVDTASVPLAALRAALCIVPQEPLLLKGSLRFNLDPWGSEGSGALEAACAASGLRDSLQPLALQAAAEGGGGGGGSSSSSLLDLHIEEGGRNLSLGQQQLVCLTRAMLRAPPLLALDEAAAAADARTHALLQGALMQRSGGLARTTVVLVAHRLESVLGCDQVLVLQGGEAVELGPPQELLARAGGAFAALVAESRRAL